MTIYLYGAGEIARVANSYFKHYQSKADDSSNQEDIRVLVEKKYLPDLVNKKYKMFDGAEYWSKDRVATLEDYSLDMDSRFFLSISYASKGAAGPNSLKEYICKKLQELPDVYSRHQNRFISHIHPDASVFPDTGIGRGVWIQENCAVQTGAKIGNFVTLWGGTGCHIGHKSVIEDYCFISTGSVVSGNCRIGRNTFIGINCSIKDGIEIGHSNIIGMGAIITRSTKPYEVYLGGVNKLYHKTSQEVDL